MWLLVNLQQRNKTAAAAVNEYKLCGQNTTTAAVNNTTHALQMPAVAADQAPGNIGAATLTRSTPFSLPAALPAHVADLIWRLSDCQVLIQVRALESCRLELHAQRIVLCDGVLGEPADCCQAARSQAEVRACMGMRV
jgi:hypothetical protein